MPSGPKRNDPPLCESLRSGMSRITSYLEAGSSHSTPLVGAVRSPIALNRVIRHLSSRAS